MIDEYINSYGLRAFLEFTARGQGFKAERLRDWSFGLVG